jgi:hypothetical protein
METARIKIMKYITFTLFAFCFIFQSQAKQGIQDYLSQNITQYQQSPKLDKLFPFNEIKFNSDIFIDSFQSKSLIYTQSALDINLNFSTIFGLHSKFGLEKIKGTTFYPLNLEYHDINYENKLFYGHSLTAKEFSLFFDFNNTRFYLGKITPHFGVGSERVSEIFYQSWYGISGTFLNQGYALNDKFGLIVDVDAINFDYLKIKFQASLFANDSSTLYSKPFFINREIEDSVTLNGQKKRWPGSDSIKSHALSLQGFFAFTQNDILSFNFGYKNQFSKFNGINEVGLTGALQYNKILFNDIIITLFGEYTQILDSYSVSSFDEVYRTLSLSSSFKGIKIGILQNYYHSNNSSTITLLEYFIGFQVPETKLSFTIARKQYKNFNQNNSGFGFNMNYQIY